MNHVERSQVLEKVGNGELSVEEAVGLMSSQEEPSPLPKPAGARRWLRIRVSNLDTGVSKVNINLPLGWVKFGWRLGSRFAPELDDWDLDDMIASLDQAIEGCIVQVENADDNKRVEIYVD